MLPAMRRAPLSLLVSLLCVPACGDSGTADGSGTDTTDGGATEPATGTPTPTTGEADTTATTGPAVDPPTYWQDIAPIYFDKCVTCHQPGGIGPFRLDVYDDARTWAAASATVSAMRIMPPWLVTDDGSCGEFQDSPVLTDDEIAGIEAWAAAGAPEGEPQGDLSPPAPETLDDGVEYKTPMFAPEIQGGDLAEFDEYRCFLIDPGLAEDRFITGYSVTPGTPALIHHVLAITVDPAASAGQGQTNADVIAALDAESPDRDGWPCFGLAGDGVDPVGVPVTWAPGMGVSDFPPGVGFRVEAGHKYVVQVHYNLVDPELAGAVDQTSLHIRYADSVEREGYFDLPDDFLTSLYSPTPAQLAPGQASVEFSFDYALDYLPFFGVQSADLYGVFPHMHQRGRKLRVELVEAGGEPQCAADVQRWDFGWQLYYFYEQPIPLTTKSVLRITCEYDTQSASEPVLPGWGTQNEMCLAGLFIVPHADP